jgi:hypothetical protein
MATGWYALKQGAGPEARTGPHSWEELYRLTLTGGLQPADLVWNQELPEWLPAARIPGLFGSAACAAAPAAIPAVAAAPARPYPAPSLPAKKRRWVLPVVIALIALIVVGGGGGTAAWYFWLRDGGSSTTAASGDGTPTSDSGGNVTSTTVDESGLGKAEIKIPDRTKVLPTETWGPVPVNQLIAILMEGQKRADADKLAKSLGGTVVGEIELINAFQIETAGATEADLKAAIDSARATVGVTSAFPNQTVKAAASEIWGKRISATDDPAYADDAGEGYKLIGVDKAWSYIKGADMELSPVQVGVVDTGVYTGTGEFDGGVNITYTDPSAQLSGAPQTTYSDGTTGPETQAGHGTGINTIIGGDADDGGPVGVASPLGGMLTISNTNMFVPPYSDGVVAADPDPNDPSIRELGGGTYSFSDLKAIMAQVKAGSTVINLSWGPADYTKVDPQLAQAYRGFFEQLSKEKPEIIFVVAAGNDGVSMNGDQNFPGGFKLPNMITVGNVSNDSKMFKDSNTKSENFEVTLSAPGEESVRGSQGNTTHEDGGTSAAAPHVAAAAALLKSLNPKLDAAMIKEILRVTARKNEAGDPILAVDEAVFEVINMNRETAGLPALTREELENRGVIDAVATPVPNSPNEFMVRAIVQSMTQDGVDVTISPSAGVIKEGETPRHMANTGEIAWLVKMDDNKGTITVLRGDNKAGSRISLERIDINGKWAGSVTFTEINVDGAASGGGGGDTVGGGEGCNLAMLDTLKGKALAMTMDITCDTSGNGTAITSIDFTSLNIGDPQYGKFVNEPTTIPFVYAGDTITFTTQPSEGTTGGMSGVVSKQNDRAVIEGTITSSGKGFSIKAVWTVTQ